MSMSDTVAAKEGPISDMSKLGLESEKTPDVTFAEKKNEAIRTEENEQEKEESLAEKVTSEKEAEKSVPAAEPKLPKVDNDNALGHAEEESGSSDSDHYCQDRVLKIREKAKFFNSKKHLARFIRKTVDKIE